MTQPRGFRATVLLQKVRFKVSNFAHLVSGIARGNVKILNPILLQEAQLFFIFFMFFFDKEDIFLPIRYPERSAFWGLRSPNV